VGVRQGKLAATPLPIRAPTQTEGPEFLILHTSTIGAIHPKRTSTICCGHTAGEFLLDQRGRGPRPPTWQPGNGRHRFRTSESFSKSRHCNGLHARGEQAHAGHRGSARCAAVRNTRCRRTTPPSTNPTRHACASPSSSELPWQPPLYRSQCRPRPHEKKPQCLGRSGLYDHIDIHVRMRVHVSW
jgi:hypothetical protein